MKLITSFAGFRVLKIRLPFDLHPDKSRLSVPGCIEDASGLAVGARYQHIAAPPANIALLLNEPREAADPVAKLARKSAMATLLVEVGWEVISLSGINSSEQAIAKIEEHLLGKKSSTLKVDRTFLPTSHML